MFPKIMGSFIYKALLRMKHSFLFNPRFVQQLILKDYKIGTTRAENVIAHPNLTCLKLCSVQCGKGEVQKKYGINFQGIVVLCNGYFNSLTMNFYCVSVSKRGNQNLTSDFENITRDEYLKCHLKLDKLINIIHKHLPSNQGNYFVIRHENVQLKQHLTVQANHATNLLERRLFQRKLNSALLTENNISSRLFSTASNVGDEQSNSANVLFISNKLYNTPKNVLHNAYDVVAKELNDQALKIQPTYNIVGRKQKRLWCCTYNIKWPESMKFVSTAQTKQDASHKAALSALLWLRKNEKINKDGHPVIVGKQEIIKITTHTVPTLTLGSQTINQMKNLTDIYTQQFVPLLTENLDKRKRCLEVKEIFNPSDDVLSGKVKKLFASSKYMAKEKINLPISQYKNQFINLLGENRVIVLKGEPGCGKSTRIPQYVLELWAQDGLGQGQPCNIAVTQPRRIAAISLADRVSDERGEQCGQIVGYQVRLNCKFNPVTGRILYCTTGILLKHFQTDINLLSFTHIILDEAHERDVNTDLLMNLLRNALIANPNLKLIIMSATVDVDMFKKYFNDAPVIHIPGFTYPVKSYFLDDFSKLIDVQKSCKSDDNEIPTVVHEDVVRIIKHIHKTKGEGAILCFLPGWEDIMKIEKLLPVSNGLTVLCLHSRLQDGEQQKIFSKPPPGVRKVILSTNIAESSVTINDVVYVIDTGIHKENRFDNDKGVTCIDNYWISQSNMIQRKGRAGRVQSGESFHMYTQEKYASFCKYPVPEILKTSLTKIVLNCKVYSNNMDALEFMSQLPSPPEKISTRRAVKELKELRLLDENENLTSLGRTLANFQLEPKLAKILINAVVYKCVTPVIDIVTIFSADTELFTRGLVDKEGIKLIKAKANRHSDHLAVMRLFEAWLELMEERDANTAERYCTDANLAHHKLVTLNKLRKIHFDYLYNNLHSVLPIADNYSDNDELVKALLFSGVGTLLRHRNWDIVKGRYKKGNVFLTNYNQKASITSDSVNFKKTSFSSNCLLYFNEIRSNIRKTTLVRESSVIAPLAVLLFSDKELLTKEGESEDVILGLKDTKIEFTCVKEEAVHIRKCKEVLDLAYSYFIFQMTEGGEYNSRINQIWDTILEHINSILLKHSIK